MMLNEVWELAKALDAVGARVTQKNPRVVEDPAMRTSPPLRVRLHLAGQVTAVEEITEDEWAGVWTIRDGNANSFPIVRPTDPLILIAQNDPFWRQVDRDAIDEIWRLQGSKVHVKSSDWQRLVARARELCAATSAAPTPCARLIQFAEAFDRAASNLTTLVSEIANMALANWREGRLSSKSAQDAVSGLLVGEWEKTKSGEKQRANVQLLFDVADASSFSDSIYCEEVRRHVVEVLPPQVEKDRKGRRRVNSGSKNSPQCALTGNAGDLLKEKFPKVTLPVFKQAFPIFARFKDADCHRRYGMIESESMPILQSSARRLQEGLAHIVRSDKEGHTWRSVASGKFERRNGKMTEKRDLLIVYPEAKPDLDARVAAIFGEDEDSIESKFDADTKTVCKALEGVASAEPTSRLRIFTIRKMDKARAMVVLSESPTVPEVIAAAAQWSEGAGNVPEIVIPLPPNEKKQAPIDGRPRTPYPDQVVRLLSEQWVREGKQSTKVSSISLGDVLHLMLRTSGKWEAVRDQMLGLLISRTATLLIGIGGKLSCYRLDKKPWEGYPKNARSSALCAAAVAGILLHAHNRQREVYMTSSAFDIGQMLKLADILHKDYCIVVRKGSLPPSLIGNAIMPRAFDNPRMAVADLADRMRVYAGWAKIARDPQNTGENDETLIAVREARKTLRRFEPLASRLIESKLPEWCDNAMKAEILLGYLAKVQNINTSNDKEQNDD